MSKLLSHKFYAGDTVLVAQQLLGKVLVRETVEGIASGRIVETEAYLFENDPACHAARGKTRRNASMFGPPAQAYVYSIHTRHCLNFSTEEEGVGAAVLIRAIEPLEGVPLMQMRRGREKLVELTRGPGRLCEALAIDLNLDGADLTRREALWVEADPSFNRAGAKITATERIGISRGKDLLLRFFLDGNRFVSGLRRRHTLPLR